MLHHFKARIEIRDGRLSVSGFMNASRLQPLIRESREEVAGVALSQGMLLVENLHVMVDGTPIIKGLNLTFYRREIHLIMGRNGAGKSIPAKVALGPPAY